MFSKVYLTFLADTFIYLYISLSRTGLSFKFVMKLTYFQRNSTNAGVIVTTYTELGEVGVCSDTVPVSHRGKAG